MIGVALRRGVSVRHQLLNKNTALVFTENPVRFLSDRNEKDIYCPHKKPKVCHKPIDQTRLGADCKEVQDAITDKNYPTMDCNSPMGPPPPNYDPYRIKVPDYIVPPLPPSGAKPMLHCASLKSHCCPAPPCCPPPCCPPPKKPFPWMYVVVPIALLSLAGLVWKCMLSNDKGGHIQHFKTKHEFDTTSQTEKTILHIACVGKRKRNVNQRRGMMIVNATPQDEISVSPIFIISQEDVYPYDVRPMSKYMWFNREPPDIATLNYIADHRRYTMYVAECRDFMDPVKFYQKKTGPAVSIATGYCVVRLDADDHVAYVATTCGEQAMYYERCLLAPGAKPKNLQFFKTAAKPIREKVCLLRSIRDLEIAFRKVQQAQHVTIIGGGTLGTELAYFLGRRNKTVARDEDQAPVKITQIIKDKGIMGSTLPEYLGKWLRELIRCQGVDVIHSTQVYDAFLNKDNKLELTLSNGKSLLTDYVFVAVGADPRTNLAEESMLELDDVNGGYLVNTEQEARKHLYVAGDAASVYFQWKDERMRLEHHSNAEDEGYIAGSNMTGYWIPNNMEPHYAVKLLEDLHFEVVGETGACMPTIALYKPCAEDEIPGESTKDKNAAGDSIKCYEKGKEYRNLYKRGLLFYLRDETIVGIIFWNYPAEIPSSEDRKGVATEILRAKPTYKDVGVIAELLGFKDAKCVYLSAAELNKEECLSIPYKDYSGSPCPPPKCPLKPCDEVHKRHVCK